MRFAVVDTLKTGKVSEPLIQEENEISKKKIGTTSIIQDNENNLLEGSFAMRTFETSSEK